MSKTLNIDVGLVLVQAANGADTNIVQPPFSRAITIEDTESYRSHAIPVGGSYVDILPPGAAEKTMLCILPTYGTTNTSDANYGRLKIRVTVTGPVNHDVEMTEFGCVSVPANCTAIQLSNPDPNNATLAQVVATKRG